MSSRRVTLISPNLVFQGHDLFTTGIVYMPIGVASVAATLRREGFSPSVVDAFGEAPNRFWRRSGFVFRGLVPEQAAGRVAADSVAIGIYAQNLTYHHSVLALIAAARQRFPGLPIFVFENTQAVTAYAVAEVREEFFRAGADYVLSGEPEMRVRQLLEALIAGSRYPEIDGLAYQRDGSTVASKPAAKITKLDDLAWPAWDLLPVANYWSLRYAHGPMSAAKYLPLLTSRGCPYVCKFCVIPETNAATWRARSAASVVDEIEHWVKTLGIREFHIEDVDPTVNDKRTQEICRTIIARGLDIRWKLVSGTKVETLKSEQTIDLMAQAGCRYISISPESGSQRVMKLINKPFDYDLAVRLVRRMNQVGIRSQACFVLGFPGEQAADRELTRQMVHDLSRAGVDEIAQFIVTPVPGSDVYQQQQLSGYRDYSELHFSPQWRSDYRALNRFRVALYRDFLWWKMRYHPMKLLRQPFNFLRRRFETKMEMVPYRALKLKLALMRLDPGPVALEDAR